MPGSKLFKVAMVDKNNLRKVGRKFGLGTCNGLIGCTSRRAALEMISQDFSLKEEQTQNWSFVWSKSELRSIRNSSRMMNNKINY